MTDDINAGPATWEMVQQLHRAVVAELTARLRGGRVGAALLLVARKVLRDNGLGGLAHEASEREQLQQLYRCYVQRLSEAVRDGRRPSAAILGEVRVFLTGAGITKDLQQAADTHTALALLADQRVPFNPQ